MKNQIAILILFFNKLEETIACIESFLPSKQQIYVLNNGSDATLWKNLQQQYSKSSQINLFHSERNLGVSVGRNLLIQNTREPWILIVDNDITAKQPDTWVDCFHRALAKRPFAKVFTLRVYNVHEKQYAGSLQVVCNSRNVSVRHTDAEVTNCFPGTGSLIHREIFSRHGLFDENLFVGFEDYEFALRCMQSPEGELNVFCIKEIEMIHDHKVQKKMTDKKAVRERYNEASIRASYDHIEKKFNVKFDHHWEWWTRKQVKEMTGGSLVAQIRESIRKRLSLR